MSANVLAIITFVCLVAYVAFEKLVLPKVSQGDINNATTLVDTAIDITTKFQLVFTMAKKFVILAKKEFADGQGEQKRDWVIKQLEKLCKKLDIVLTDEELKAVNEDAYNTMKKNE